ncbi:MAG: hypothetical protein WAQ27_00800 [Candidatus Microsaccharimonas sp.]
MLELFPLSKTQIFQLPDLALPRSGGSSYTSLFLNELLSLETSAKRCLVPAGYARNPDGSANLSLPDITLDVSTFYLFAHKTLVSAIFIFAKTIPHEKAKGVTFRSYTAFTKDVLAEKNETLALVHKKCGKQLSWAQKALINKRDDLVQHWQGNSSNKFFTMIYAWDLPYLVYYNPETVNKLDQAQVDFVCSQVKQKVKNQLDPQADTLQKLAWMEAWHPKLSIQLQRSIDKLLDNNIYISLPVTPQLIEKLDKTIASLLEMANTLR